MSWLILGDFYDLTCVLYALCVISLRFIDNII